jgi:hypothetical protein
VVSMTDCAGTPLAQSTGLPSCDSGPNTGPTVGAVLQAPPANLPWQPPRQPHRVGPISKSYVATALDELESTKCRCLFCCSAVCAVIQ